MRFLMRTQRGTPNKRVRFKKLEARGLTAWTDSHDLKISSRIERLEKAWRHVNNLEILQDCYAIYEVLKY